MPLYYFDLNEPESPDFYTDRISEVAEEADVAPVALTNLADGRDVPLVAREPDTATLLNVVSRPSASSDRHDVAADESEDRDKLDDLMDALDQIEL